MSFVSVDFGVFLLVVLCLHWLLPQRMRGRLLLIASYTFYGWVQPWLVVLLGVVTVLNWACARVIDERPDWRRAGLLVAVIGCLAVLGTFKYFDFFVDNVQLILGSMGVELPPPSLQLVLPVGVSFYTFQALSYTLDVWRGETQARTRLEDVALYVSFFPQLVAGPIERVDALLPQLQRPRHLTAARVEAALMLLAWGFFKKLVVADNLAPVVDSVFALRDATGPLVRLAAYAFALQIYADFSAYTDIARGVATLFGVDLVRNFETPYMSTSISDFWGRWHTSMTTFFRDYVYLPLAGRRRSIWWLMAAALFTFGLSGLWHGAGWNYVAWGLYHGVLLLLGRGWTRLGGTRLTRGAVFVPVKILVTFCLVTIGLVIFRETGGFAWILWDIDRLFRVGPTQDVFVARFLAGRLCLLTAPVWGWEILSRWREWRRSAPLGFGWRVVALPLLVWATLTFAANEPVSFIYFQF